MNIELSELFTSNILLYETESLDSYEGNLNGEKILVKLNDFPDEVMYTIFFKNDELHLDDLPDGWKIIYR
jgi:hypothetical protein